MTEVNRQKEKKCQAIQVNMRAPDLECRIATGHTVHVDPRTGVRWGDHGPPLGMRRKYPKKYANHKLSRQSAVMARIGQKDTKKGAKNA